MNLWEMILGVVIIATIGSVIRARYGVHTNVWGKETAPAEGAATIAENRRLRDEIRSLRERVQVLERVVTDNESGQRLDREIEKLRDKNSV